MPEDIVNPDAGSAPFFDRLLDAVVPGRRTQKNLEKALGRGIGAAGDGTANWLRAWLKKHERRQLLSQAADDLNLAQLQAEKKLIETKSRSDAKLIEAAAQAKIALYNEFGRSTKTLDPDLTKRALTRLTAELFDNQQAREQICGKAIEQLQLLQPPEDAQTEIEDDWLTTFWDISERKTNPEIQIIFARILAGECAKPGTFEPRTLHVMTVLTQSAASTFERICRIAARCETIAFIPSECFRSSGELSSKICEPFGFDIEAVLHMRELGLVHPRPVVYGFVGNESTSVGGCNFIIENEFDMNVTSFTRAGTQLFNAICVEPDVRMRSTFADFLARRNVKYRTA